MKRMQAYEQELENYNAEGCSSPLSNDDDTSSDHHHTSGNSSTSRVWGAVQDPNKTRHTAPSRFPEYT